MVGPSRKRPVKRSTQRARPLAGPRTRRRRRALVRSGFSEVGDVSGSGIECFSRVEAEFGFHTPTGRRRRLPEQHSEIHMTVVCGLNAKITLAGFIVSTAVPSSPVGGQFNEVAGQICEPLVVARVHPPCCAEIETVQGDGQVLGRNCHHQVRVRDREDQLCRPLSQDNSVHSDRMPESSRSLANERGSRYAPTRWYGLGLVTPPRSADPIDADQMSPISAADPSHVRGGTEPLRTIEASS